MTLLVAHDAILMPRMQDIVPICDDNFASISRVLKSDTTIGLVQKNDAGIFKTGTLAKILDINETDQKQIFVKLGGIARFVIENLKEKAGVITAEVNYDAYAADIVEYNDFSIDRKKLLSSLMKYLKNCNVATDIVKLASFPNELLIKSLSMSCPFSSKEKQALLEIPSMVGQYEEIVTLLEMSNKSSPHFACSRTIH